MNQMTKLPFYARVALTLFAISLVIIVHVGGQIHPDPFILCFSGLHPAASDGSLF